MDGILGWYRGRWKCTECGFRLECDSETSADKHIMGIGETLRGVGVVRAEEGAVEGAERRGFRKVRRKRREGGGVYSGCGEWGCDGEEGVYCIWGGRGVGGRVRSGGLICVSERGGFWGDGGGAGAWASCGGVYGIEDADGVGAWSS